MPRYDYICKACDSNFFIISGINDNRDNTECSKCGSKDVKRIFNSTILKGKRAKGYNEEVENTPKSEVMNKSHEEHDHDHGHCSPDLDYL